jgi:hypothetical protein
MLTGGASARALRLTVLTVDAWLGLLAFDLARAAGFARVHRWVKHCRPRARRSSASIEEIVWAVDEACLVCETRGMFAALGGGDVAAPAPRVAGGARHRVSSAAVRIARMGGSGRAGRQRSSAVSEGLHGAGSSVSVGR